MHGTKAGGACVEADAGAGPTPVKGLARVKTAPRPMPSPQTAEHGAPADDAPLHRSKSFEAGSVLEAASKQDRAPDTVYSLPFPVIIAPEALMTDPAEGAEGAEGAEPAKKKAVVPAYHWHAVVPLVKSEQPPEQAAPAAAASEVRGLQPDQDLPRTAVPGAAAPAAGAVPDPTLAPGVFEGGAGELVTPTADTVFEDILRRRIVQNGHLATVEMKPDPEMAAREKKAAAAAPPAVDEPEPPASITRRRRQPPPPPTYTPQPPPAEEMGRPAVELWPSYRKVTLTVCGWNEEGDSDGAAAEVAEGCGETDDEEEDVTMGSPSKTPKRAEAPQAPWRKPWVGRAPDAHDAHLVFA